MKTILSLLISSFFLAASCRKEKLPDIQKDENDIIIKTPYIWKKSLHNGYDFNSNSNFDLAVYYNGNILIPTTNGPNIRQMTLLNPDNGNFIWSWDDRYQPATEDIYTIGSYLYNNFLTYQNGDRSYCINLDNGTTHWKFRRNKSFYYRLGDYNNGYYTIIGDTINQNGNKEYVSYIGNINTGNLSFFLEANLSSNYVNPRNSIGGIEYVGRLPNNDSLIYVYYNEPLPTWVQDPYLGLYNVNTNTWVWERKQLTTPTLNSGLFGFPIYHNNTIIASIGKNLVCSDLSTGEVIWQRSFPQDFLFSGFILAEDKIIANNEDTYTYCLNPQNGAIIWKTKSAGTSGRMSYLNGVVYFVGGSTGKLHAIDIDTGKHVWKLDPNLFEDNSQGTRYFKTNAIYVFEAEGNKPARVIALTHHNVYCFDAYR